MAVKTSKKHLLAPKALRPVARAWLVGATVVTAVVCAPMAAATSTGGDSPSLRGAWRGEREVINSATGFFRGAVTLKISEQRDRTFRGTVTYVTANGPMSKPVVGAFTPDVNVMSGSNDEGVYTFKLINHDILDYCYAEFGVPSATSCGRLKRGHH
ncbi:hypothetical protein ACFVJ4_43290 [Streptomyces sp. NPDC127178]|uniref:hypothetical protein n=1 Tax=unclassified Streptomyces TaxID=2593676 RepID=UPI003631E022